MKPKRKPQGVRPGKESPRARARQNSRRACGEKPHPVSRGSAPVASLPSIESTPFTPRATWDSALPTPATVALDPDFLRFAACFDIHPVRLAERLLTSFVRRRPRILEITAIPFPPPPSRRR